MKLYHYTTGQGLKGLLDTNEFHCSNISFLNDPSEIDYVKKLVNKIVEENDLYKSIHSKLYHKSEEDFFSNPTKFILSFCRNKDSLSMWNRYAKDDGYCIGVILDIEKISTQIRNNDYFVDKLIVEYDIDKQTDIIKQIILDYSYKLEQIKHLNYDYQGCPLEELKMNYTFELLSLNQKFKHPAYRDEEEVRLVISVMDYCQDKSIIDYKISKDGTFIEYFKLNVNFEDILNDVICSPNSSEQKYKGIESFLNYKFGFEKINLTKSQIPYR